MEEKVRRGQGFEPPNGDAGEARRIPHADGGVSVFENEGGIQQVACVIHFLDDPRDAFPITVKQVDYAPAHMENGHGRELQQQAYRQGHCARREGGRFENRHCTRHAEAHARRLPMRSPQQNRRCRRPYGLQTMQHAHPTTKNTATSE